MYHTIFAVACVYLVVARNDDAVAVDSVVNRQRSVSIMSFKFV